jgi:hypothetical protein
MSDMKKGRFQFSCYQNQPVEWCEEFLEVEFSFSQKRALTEISRLLKTTFTTSNMTLAACVALWNFIVFPYPKVITIAPTHRELTILWTEVDRLYERLEKKIEIKVKRADVELKLRPDWFLLGRDCSDSSKIRGFCGEHVFFVLVGKIPQDIQEIASNGGQYYHDRETEDSREI